MPGGPCSRAPCGGAARSSGRRPRARNVGALGLVEPAPQGRQTWTRSPSTAGRQSPVAGSTSARCSGPASAARPGCRPSRRRPGSRPGSVRPRVRAAAGRCARSRAPSGRAARRRCARVSVDVDHGQSGADEQHVAGPAGRGGRRRGRRAPTGRARRTATRRSVSGAQAVPGGGEPGRDHHRLRVEQLAVGGAHQHAGAGAADRGRPGAMVTEPHVGHRGQRVVQGLVEVAAELASRGEVERRRAGLGVLAGPPGDEVAGVLGQRAHVARGDVEQVPVVGGAERAGRNGEGVGVGVTTGGHARWVAATVGQASCVTSPYPSPSASGSMSAS